MNEFTKEELESIKNAMGCLNINKILKGKVPTDVELINKIQSMIDNYCEHENTDFVRYDKNKRMIRCQACRLTLWKER